MELCTQKIDRWTARLYQACYPCDKSEIGWQLARVKEQKKEYEQKLIQLDAKSIQ